MKNIVRNILIGAVTISLSASGVYAQQNGECMAGQNDAMPPPPMCDMQGPHGQQAGFGQGQGPMMQCGPQMNHSPNMQGQRPMMQGPKGGPNMRGPHMPEVFEERMEQLRLESAKIRNAWVQAVAERGNKSIEDTKKDFEKANAAQIEKLKADSLRLKEDMDAIREGLNMPFVPGANRMSMNMENCGPDADIEGEFAPEDLRIKIATEMAAELNSIKGDITPEALEAIRKKVFADNSEALRCAARDAGMMRYGAHLPPPPQMMPELARMRTAMDDARKLSFSDRRDIRSAIRDAMKIEDREEREAAIEVILNDLHDKAGQADAPHQAQKPAKNAKSGK